MARDAVRVVLVLVLIGTIATIADAQVVITRPPTAIMQPVDAPAETTTFVVANAGSEAASISISRSETFFTVTPSSFVLQPRTTQTVTIRPVVTEGGFYDATVTVTVNGQPQQLTAPVRLFIGQRPSGSTTAGLATPFIILSGLRDQIHTRTFNVGNVGSAPLQGTMVPDVPWIVPPEGLLGIAPGVSERITFSVDPRLRPDGADPLGALIGSLSLVYLRGTSGDVGIMQTESVTATVVDITKASVVTRQPTPLAAGEIASFLAGISDKTFTSHVFISNRTSSVLPALQLFYSAANANPASSLLASLGSLPSASSAWFPYVPGSIFDVSNQSGSVQLRNAQEGQASLAGLTSVLPDARNLYLTTIPRLVSTGAVPGGESVIFSGVEKSATASTDLHMQETAGHAGTLTVDFFDEDGAAIPPSMTESIQPFGYLPLTNVVPTGARSVRVTNTSTSQARLSGYATVIDSATRDRWTITDSRSSGLATELFVPMPSLTDEATGTIDVWITNGSTEASPVTVATAPLTPARRRAVRRGGTNAGLEAALTNVVDAFTLAPSESRKVTIADAPLGHVRVYGPAGAISATGRLTSSASGRTGFFGTGIPATAAPRAGGTGSRWQFALADDQPNFSPPALLLLETSGQPATVRVTMRFSFPGGSTATGQATAFRDYVVPGGERFTITNLPRSVIGEHRDSLGRLFKIVIDVEVVAGTGRVLPFLQTIDPSGDLTLFSD